MERGLYLICYDISDNRTRRRACRLIKPYRAEGQKSVNECLCTRTEISLLVAELRQLIDAETDRVHVIALDPRLERRGWGKGHPWQGGAFMKM